jgi:hypothetical protein
MRTFPSRIAFSGQTAVLLVLVVLVGSGFWASAGSSSGAAAPLRDDSGSSLASAPAGAVVSGTLGLGQALENLTPEFWAVNYNYQTGAGGFDNRTVAALLNETPITWIRFPLLDTSYQDASTWEAIAQFCDSVHCHSIATVGGPGITAQDAANDVVRAESLGIHPDYWVLGNEPNLWPGETPIEYANLVHAWIQLVHASDPSAKFLGAEISGNPAVGSQYIYNVTKVDGPSIQALAIQVYPQVGGSTLADFLASLTAGASVQHAILNARALMATACPSCSIPLLLDEVNGGSGLNVNYLPYREQFPDATFLAASIVQGLRLGLQQFAPWTLTAASTTSASETNHCDFGMIQLLPGCDGEYLQPTFSLYQNLLSRLPLGALTNVTFPGAPDFYGIQSTNATDRTLLVVNADPTETENFTLGSGFPTSGNVLTYLMDPSHVATPLADLAKATSTFSLPPTGVMTLSFSPEAQVALTASPSELAIGNTTQIRATVDGAPGTLSYSYPDLPPGCASVNRSQLSCEPTEVGSFPTTVVVTEENATVGTAQTVITVTSSGTTSDPTFYEATFVETGLPSGTSWSIQVNGTSPGTTNATQGPTLWNGTLLNSTNATESIMLLNGTYFFSIGPLAGYVADPTGGEFNVTGNSSRETVGFSAQPTVALTASPSELALGSMTEIRTTVEGAPGILSYSYADLPPGCSSQNLSQVDCTPAAVGSFAASVVVTEGNARVGTAATDVTVTPSNTTTGTVVYAVTFAEAGLPSGIVWSVLLNHTTLTTSNATQGTTLGNGTYAFGVVPVTGYVADPAAGDCNVSGTPQLVVVGFSPVNTSHPGGSNNSTSTSFAVTFRASGLSASPQWTLTLDGIGYGVNVANFTVDLSQGVHTFAINASGYSANPAAGVVVSRDSSYLQPINFTPLGLAELGSTPSGMPAAFLSTLHSPFLLELLAAVGAVAVCGPYARRTVRRRGYAQWFEEEQLRDIADRRADVARELTLVPAIVQQWTATSRSRSRRSLDR